LWVKNGPDALEMGCLFHPRKQTWLAELPGALIFINAEAALLGSHDNHLLDMLALRTFER
jgi:hypothetical protein